MAKIKDNDLILARRMQEFCRPPTAWNRAIWGVSLQTMLREVLEASEIRRHGILSDESVSDLQHSASILVGTDPGAGIEKNRRYLQQLLSSNKVVTPGSLTAESVKAAIDDLDHEYLKRWAKSAAGGVSDSVLERCARSVVSHLIDLGHSPRVVLDRIQTAAFSATAIANDAESLINELDSLNATPVRNYDAVFPLKAAPLSRQTKSISWLSGKQVVEWIRRNNVDPIAEGERISGGIKVSVFGRDPWAAAEQAFGKFEMIRNRANLVQLRPIVALDYFWLSGQFEKSLISPRKRGVEVASLARQDRIYTLGEDTPSIERAIDLLSELEHGPASSAVTNGWAAMESLSMGPAEHGNRVEAAIRMAYLVTASFVRAELTTLAYSYAKSNRDALANQIMVAKSNKEKTGLLMQQLVQKTKLPFNRVEDSAAAIRMLHLLSDPTKTLDRVQNYVETTFKRFYRLRNMVAHGGRTDSIVLGAGLRAAAPLIGAAFDRIHHASTVQKLTPVELVARAKLRINLLDSTRPEELLGLLD